MKIKRVEVWEVAAQQEVPYAVAYGDFDVIKLVFLRIETDAGLIGYGSAGCDSEVTGETSETVCNSLRDIAAPILHGGDPLALSDNLRELQLSLHSQPSALAAVDMALFDIQGKQRGLPLWKLLGGYRYRIATSITIGILPEIETLEAAKAWIARGFTCLKIKGGRDVDSDISRVNRLRKTVGSGIEIRFDANQGYTVQQAIKFARATRPA